MPRHSGAVIGQGKRHHLRVVLRTGSALPVTTDGAGSRNLPTSPQRARLGPFSFLEIQARSASEGKLFLRADGCPTLARQACGCYRPLRDSRLLTDSISPERELPELMTLVAEMVCSVGMGRNSAACAGCSSTYGFSGGNRHGLV